MIDIFQFGGYRLKEPCDKSQDKLENTHQKTSVDRVLITLIQLLAKRDLSIQPDDLYDEVSEILSNSGEAFRNLRNKVEDNPMLKQLNSIFESVKRENSCSENDKLVKDFLKEARNCLNSSENNYKSRIYSESVFQAVRTCERYAKAVSLHFFNSHKNVRHRTPKLFMKAEFEPFLKNIREFMQICFPELTPLKDIDEYSRDVNSMWNNPYLQKLSFGDLMGFLTTTDMFRKMFEDVIDSFRSNLPRTSTRTVESYITNLVGYLDMYILSILLIPHYISSQYPDNKPPERFKESALVPRNYRASLGIVKALPEIHRHLHNVDKLFKQIGF